MGDKTETEIAADAEATKDGGATKPAAANAAPNADTAATDDSGAAGEQEALNAATKVGLDAVAALLESTRAANPTIPADLISGDSVETIAASVAAGKTVVDAVVKAQPAPVQAGGGGSPPRPVGPDGPPEGSTGLQKIAWALNHPGAGSTTPPA